MLGQNFCEAPNFPEVLWSGVGATRITFGSRKSHFTSAPWSLLKLLGFRPERI
jgi:hypothetical protein